MIDAILSGLAAFAILVGGYLLGVRRGRLDEHVQHRRELERLGLRRRR